MPMFRVEAMNGVESREKMSRVKGIHDPFEKLKIYPCPHPSHGRQGKER